MLLSTMMQHLKTPQPKTTPNFKVRNSLWKELSPELNQPQEPQEVKEVPILKEEPKMLEKIEIIEIEEKNPDNLENNLITENQELMFLEKNPTQFLLEI